jgi:RHS repeat-associated protein
VGSIVVLVQLIREEIAMVRIRSLVRGKVEGSQSDPTTERKAKRSVLTGIAFFLLVFIHSSLWSQDPQGAGIPNNTTALPVPLGFINLANGNLHLEIPFGTMKQRANSEPIFLKAVYDSRVWSLPGIGWWGGGGGGVVTNLAGGFATYDTQPFPCNDQISDIQEFNFRYYDSEGNVHIFFNSTGSTVNTTVGVYCADNHPDSGYAADGSGYFIKVWNTVNGNLTNTNFVVYGPSGNQVYPKVEDSNGNFMNYLGTPPPGAPSVDTLGRTNPIVFTNACTTGPCNGGSCNGNPNATCIDVPNSNGGMSRYVVVSEQIDVCTAFHFGGGDEYCTVPYTDQHGRTIPANNRVTVMQSITLPNGTGYTFNYDSGTTPGHYGLLTDVTLPTGATIHYTYSTFADAQVHNSNFSPNRWVTGFSTPDGNWTITPQVLGAPACPAHLVCNQLTVTKPSGDQQVYTFSSSGEPGPTDLWASAMYNGTWNTKIQYYNGTASGTPTMTTETDYTNPGVDPAPASVTVSMATPGGTLVKQTAFTYKRNGVALMNIPKTINEYGFGNGTVGPLMRSTQYTYLDEVNAAYVSANILNKPASETVWDGNGNVVEQTLYEYDNYTEGIVPSGAVQHDPARGSGFILRGNLTASERWRNTDGAFLVTRNQYDDAGNIVKRADPSGNPTYFSYADSWAESTCAPSGGNAAAYVTSITNALGQITRTNYNSCSGSAASTTDVNSQTTKYSYDLMDRLIATSYPDQGVVTTCYSDMGGTCQKSGPPFQVVTSTSIASSQTPQVVTSVKDGLGREVQRQVNSDPDGTTYVDTVYDSVGRTLSVSNPHRLAPSLTDGITQYQYDGLDRQTKAIKPDQSFTRADFSSFPITLVTDEAGIQHASQTDGLGRLTTVWEPDPTGSFTYVTTYQYDALNNLIQVHQQGGSQDAAQARTRSFVYDSLSQLVSSTNPESGVTTYAYDADGNLATRTAPAPNQTGLAQVVTSFAYDGLDRLTGKSFSSGGGEVLLYDYSNLWGVPIQNGVGRLSAHYNFALTGNGDSVGFVNSYDVMGRTVYQLQFNQRIPAQINQPFSYAYNQDDSLSSITYPSGRTISYSYNSAQRPTSVIDSLNAIKYYTEGHYTPFGAVSTMVYASAPGFAGIKWNNTYNSRMQPTRLKAGVDGKSPVLDLGYDYISCNFNNGDDGHVCKLINNNDGSRTQSFGYDQLNRLVSAGTSQWNETFGYDPWGNLLTKTITGSVAPAELATAMGVSVNSNNQVTNWCYDAAGNVLGSNPCTDYTSKGIPFPNVFDAEDRLIKSTVSGVTTSYDYGPNGQRVEKSSADGTTGTLYWSDPQGSVLEETDFDGNMNAEFIFVQGKRIARLDFPNPCRIDFPVHYFFADQLGSADVITDNKGNPEAMSDYYPFGVESNILDAGAGNHYKFTGKERDPETGLDYFGARYYGSATGRFITPDPGNAGAINIDPQSWNAYAYVRNNPASLTDPTGKVFCRPASEAEQRDGVQLVCDVTDAQYVDSTKDQQKAYDQAGYKHYDCSCDSGADKDAWQHPNGNVSNDYVGDALVFLAILAVVRGLDSPDVPDTLPDDRPNRDQKDIDREKNYPNPPAPNNGNGSIGPNPNQNAEYQRDLQQAQQSGAKDIRTNQEQVNGQGVRVGRNRPDLQYTDRSNVRHYHEYDTDPAQSAYHHERIRSNDPAGVIHPKVIK